MDNQDFSYTCKRYKGILERNLTIKMGGLPGESDLTILSQVDAPKVQINASLMVFFIYKLLLLTFYILDKKFKKNFF